MKKRQFHCERCGNPCEIYKKGKKHRVLVCPECGVIATNPLPLLATAIPTALKLGKKAGKLIGIGKGKESKEESRTQKIVTDSLDKPNKGERYVRMVMGE